ncbi:hypothetical protein Taro_004157 [Colocasia esculenta]|uniref:Ubiquitin-like protease family profile domain-containing protein n=1 Tax=Colocasia esculenta TaxID=4460 RepID=A0A843TQW5_COLES|nr:hypothetical protein [Colocasia esculenta]
MKDEGQDMDTILQALDKLVENIVPPTASAKMPLAGEKKRIVGKAISPSSLTRRVKEARRIRSQLALLKDLEYEFEGRRNKKLQEDNPIIVSSQLSQACPPQACSIVSVSSVEITADENNFLQRSDNILEPKKDGWGAYVNPEHIMSLLFGKDLESAIIYMFLLLMRRKTEDEPSKYYDYDCFPAYSKINFLKKGFLELFGLDTTKWLVVVPSPCPQQGAGDDCALFVCKYMECLSQKNIIGFPFSQADMDIFRGKLAWAIIQEVNEQKAQEMTGEHVVEKNVSLLEDA